MSSIKIKLDPNSGEIKGTYIYSIDASKPSIEDIQQALTDAGFANAELDQKALIEFHTTLQTSETDTDKILGKVHDAEFILEVSDDLMLAQLSIIPARGGKQITSQVDEELRTLGIRFGIDNLALDAAIAAGACNKVSIARGYPPTNGTLPRFDVLFQEKSHKDMHDDKAIIKLSDLGKILLVEPGEQMMRRIPPVKGINGCNIKGEIIPAKAIPEMPYGNDLAGVAVSEKDPNILIATCAGQPKQVANGAIVNPIIEVDHVDLSTGNINFDGTINVAGDIKAGMSVKVSGDVFVNGVIEAAEVIAGQDVNVKHGIIGVIGNIGTNKSDSKSLSQQIIGAGSAHISCGGSVRAQFIENAKIEADHNIEVEQSVLQSDLIAGNEIIVGNTNPERAHIIGGRTQATKLVKTGSIGSAVGVNTIVQVGTDPYLNHEIAVKEKMIQKKLEELDNINKLLAHFNGNDAKKFSESVIKKAESTHQQLISTIEMINAELSELSEKLELVENAKVIIGNAVYGGSQIFIGKQNWTILEKQQACTVLLDDGKIAITS